MSSALNQNLFPTIEPGAEPTNGPMLSVQSGEQPDSLVDYLRADRDRSLEEAAHAVQRFAELEDYVHESARKYEERLAKLREDLERARSNRAKADHRIDELKQVAARASDRSKSQERQLEAVRLSRQDQQREIAEVRMTTSAVRDRLDKAQSDLEAERERRIKLQARCDTATSRVAELTAALADAREQLEQMSEWAHSNNNELVAANEELHVAVADLRKKRKLRHKVTSRARWERAQRAALPGSPNPSS